MQREFGARSLLVAESHAEMVVAIGDGWAKSYLCTEGVHVIGCFGSYVADDSQELAGALVSWFDSLPSFGATVAEEKPQLSFEDMINAFNR